MKKDLFSDVEPQHYFWLSDGTVIKNLQELQEAMVKIDDSVFNSHVNEQKNDFHNWVRDIHGDKKLADNLLRSKTQREVSGYLMRRYLEIKNAAKIIKSDSDNKSSVKEHVDTKKRYKAAKKSVENKTKKRHAASKKRLGRTNENKKNEKNKKNELIGYVQKKTKKEESFQTESLVTYPGIVIAIAVLFFLLASYNLAKTSIVTGAAVTDLPGSSYNYFAILFSIIVIFLVLRFFILKQRGKDDNR